MPLSFIHLVFVLLSCELEAAGPHESRTSTCLAAISSRCCAAFGASGCCPACRSPPRVGFHTALLLVRLPHAIAAAAVAHNELPQVTRGARLAPLVHLDENGEFDHREAAG